MNGKLSTQDMAEIQRKYCEGKSCEHIAKLYGVSGQYIRRVAADNGWKELKAQYEKELQKESINAAKLEAKKAVKQNGVAKKEPRKEVSTARELALLAAKSPDNFGKDNPIVREFILDELRRGVSPTAACKSVGINHKSLAYWRKKDPEYNQRVLEAQADFISGLERLAAGVSTPREALSLLERHPLTRRDWGKQEESKHTIKIEYSFNRENQNVVDAEYQEVAQIESRHGGGAK